jgi:AraC-like DNA-binding protein/quercetin dioxygenase-like cupin family protein
MWRGNKTIVSSRAYSVAIHPFPGKGELIVLFAGHEQTEPSHHVGPQVRDYYLIHHVLDGKGTFQCMGSKYDIGPGQSFIVFPGELIRYDSDSEAPWRYRWIAFKGTLADQLLSELGISQHHPVVQPVNPRRTAAQFHRMEQVLKRADTSSDLESGGIIRIVLAGYVKEDRAPLPAGKAVHSPSEEQVERAIRWLTLQYAQPISIQHIAQALGYHRTHLSKLFKQYTGISPMQYLLKIRMDRAKLLLQEELTVEQVASSVGFADSLYFSKQFKKWHGCTPSEYRSGDGISALLNYNDCQ